MNTKKTKLQHVVIIPNGNRTWARKQGLRAWEGYWRTYENMKKTYKKFLSLNIPHLTLWGFSTENWKRNQVEIDKIFIIIEKVLKTFIKSLVKKKIRFNHLGRKDRLPKKLIYLIEKLETETEAFTERSINFALDYGGRDEILRAVNTLLKSNVKEISSEEFSNILDTKNLPDPDLIIRTAGEKRFSGMMPWQSTYAEYYFTEVCFPEFGPKDLKDAILDFNNRKRTFGGDVDLNAVSA